MFLLITCIYVFVDVYNNIRSNFRKFIFDSHRLSTIFFNSRFAVGQENAPIQISFFTPYHYIASTIFENKGFPSLTHSHSLLIFFSLTHTYNRHTHAYALSSLGNLFSLLLVFLTRMLSPSEIAYNVYRIKMLRNLDVIILTKKNGFVMCISDSRFSYKN